MLKVIVKKEAENVAGLGIGDLTVTHMTLPSCVLEGYCRVVPRQKKLDWSTLWWRNSLLAKIKTNWMRFHVVKIKEAKKYLSPQGAPNTTKLNIKTSSQELKMYIPNLNLQPIQAVRINCPAFHLLVSVINVQYLCFRCYSAAFSFKCHFVNNRFIITEPNLNK